MAELQFSDDDGSIVSTITSEEDDESLNLADALEYVHSVRLALVAESRDYSDFLNLFLEYKQKWFTTEEVIDRIKLLFSRPQELIEGFKQFLPAAYKIDLPPPTTSEISFEEAVSYVNKVKRAFSQEQERYDSFMGVLQGYRRSEIGIEEVSEKVSEIFRDRQDLLKEFFKFVPDSQKETFRHVMNNVIKDESTTNMTMKPKLLFLLGIALSVLVALVVGMVVGVAINK